MCTTFQDVLKNSCRNIVIHQTTLISDIMSLLQNNDLLFFDDCLYSQYVFIKEHLAEFQTKNINCVLGFSTSIYRKAGTDPIYNAYCADCHNKFHSGDMTSLQAYMTIAEIRELLKHQNIFLACHGDKHLNLEEKTNHLVRLSLFNTDIKNATKRLKKLKLTTDIFVYPYAYDNIPAAGSVLENNGYKYIFAGKTSKRLEIEVLFEYTQKNVETSNL